MNYKQFIFMAHYAYILLQQQAHMYRTFTAVLYIRTHPLTASIRCRTSNAVLYKDFQSQYYLYPPIPMGSLRIYLWAFHVYIFYCSCFLAAYHPHSILMLIPIPGSRGIWSYQFLWLLLHFLNAQESLSHCFFLSWREW